MTKEIFPIRLKTLREMKKLNQKEVADTVGIPHSTYNYYESGKRQPTISVIAKLADFYRVTADYLIGRTDSMDGIIITSLPPEIVALGVKYITISAQELIKNGLPQEIYDQIINSAKNKDS